MAVATDVVELTRQFIDALNARDLEALRASVSEDAEFRNPQGGRSLHGHEAQFEIRDGRIAAFEVIRDD
jgi:ketosteroid isomerase-like protein